MLIDPIVAVGKRPKFAVRGKIGTAIVAVEELRLLVEGNFCHFARTD